ncbi:DUF1203 domain-containing protein [Terrimonas pollutisoli]|uniref:DUF1203 domain-containing protein n=1 Tax=Terrimonas pollutisoli TaxID=3034147 RepID=UPI0023ECDFCF|nr:DUF1203 domain-containing protein [Terrimonas sp. H1YJ31]
MADFIIQSLQKKEFENLFSLSDTELKRQGIRRMTADTKPGFPCRVSLQDADIGDELLLLPYAFHETASPYRASGPVFVRKDAETAQFESNQIPLMLQHRLLSVRSYDTAGMMKGSTVIEGKELAEHLSIKFDDPAISYIHIHNAKAGCYNCVARRVPAT